MKIKMIGLMLNFVLFFVPAVYGSQSISLEPFSTSTSGDSFLEQEAGISAYAQVSSVDLDNAQEAMKVVEVRTADYVIGTVGLKGYEKKYDVNVYVDKSGWVVAYYSRNAHASKIIDFVGFSKTNQLTTSKLEIALIRICEAMIVMPSTIKYYDFRYPEATRIIIAVDKEDRHDFTETFIINVPMSLNVYDRTWAHSVQVSRYGWGDDYIRGRIKIDDIVLNAFGSLPREGSRPWHSWEGTLTVHELFPGRYLVISVYNYKYYSSSINYAVATSYVGICIIYSE